MSEWIPEVVAPEEWRAASEDFLAAEKEQMRALDALAARRRRLPAMVVIDDYAFERPEGRVHGLLDLFEGRRQLIVYRFFIDPGMDITEYPQGCPGCTNYADNLPQQPIHLNARDTTLAFVSGGSQEAIEAYRARMRWSDWPWYTTADHFSEDFGVDQYFGLNVFLRDGGDIYRTYFTTGRGVELPTSIFGLLDITPLGRQEEWEDSPDGYPQTPPYQWWRRHDVYGADQTADDREQISRALATDQPT